MYRVRFTWKRCVCVLMWMDGRVRKKDGSKLGVAWNLISIRIETWFLQMQTICSILDTISLNYNM